MSIVFKTFLVIKLLVVILFLGAFALYGSAKVDGKCIYDGPLLENNNLCGEVLGARNSTFQRSNGVYIGHQTYENNFVSVLYPSKWGISQTESTVILSSNNDVESQTLSQGIVLSRHTNSDTQLNCSRLSGALYKQYSNQYENIAIEEFGLIKLNGTEACRVEINLVDNTETPWKIITYRSISGDEYYQARSSFVASEDTTSIFANVERSIQFK